MPGLPTITEVQELLRELASSAVFFVHAWLIANAQIGIWAEERHLIKMIFRKLSRAEIPDFLALVWNVFCEFEASNYPEQAKMIFKSAIYDQNYLAMLNAYGAYKDDVPIGIIATRSGGKHIALFFVDGKYHRQGILFCMRPLYLLDFPGNSAG